MSHLFDGFDDVVPTPATIDAPAGEIGVGDATFNGSEVFLALCFFSGVDPDLARAIVEICQKKSLSRQNCILQLGAATARARELKYEMNAIPDETKVRVAIAMGEASLLEACTVATSNAFINQANIIATALTNPQARLYSSESRGTVVWTVSSGEYQPEIVVGTNLHWVENAADVFEKCCKHLPGAKYQPLEKWAGVLSSALLTTYHVTWPVNGDKLVFDVQPGGDDKFTRVRRAILSRFAAMLALAPVPYDRRFFIRHPLSVIAYMMMRLDWAEWLRGLPSQYSAVNRGGLHSLADYFQNEDVIAGIMKNVRAYKSAGLHLRREYNHVDLGALQTLATTAETEFKKWRAFRGETNRELDPTKDIGLPEVLQHYEDDCAILDVWEYVSKLVDVSAYDKVVLGDRSGVMTNYVEKILGGRWVSKTSTVNSEKSMLGKMHGVANIDEHYGLTPNTLTIVCPPNKSAGTEAVRKTDLDAFMTGLGLRLGMMLVRVRTVGFYVPVKPLTKDREVAIFPCGRRGNDEVWVLAAPKGKYFDGRPFVNIASAYPQACMVHTMHFTLDQAVRVNQLRYAMCAGAYAPWVFNAAAADGWEDNEIIRQCVVRKQIAAATSTVDNIVGSMFSEEEAKYYREAEMNYNLAAREHGYVLPDQEMEAEVGVGRKRIRGANGEPVSAPQTPAAPLPSEMDVEPQAAPSFPSTRRQPHGRTEWNADV